MMNNKMKELNESVKRVDMQMRSLDVNNKLPEHLFIANFLPLFSGEIKLSDKPDLLVTWYSIAGSHTSEVDIIDPAGNILFTVPAIADLSILNPLKAAGSKVAISDIVLLSKQYETSLPVVAENKLVQNLLAKEQELREKSIQYNQNEQRWIEILTRYGKIKNNTTNETATNTGVLVEDDMTF